ncbi:predicted protein, partial [Nematostella vectensis]
GLTTPALYDFWTRWAPPEEKSKLLSFTKSGMYIGLALCPPLSGKLVKYFGWSSLFYFSGAACLLWSLVWLAVVKHSP